MRRLPSGWEGCARSPGAIGASGINRTLRVTADHAHPPPRRLTLPSRLRGEEPGQFNRFGDHRPVAGVDVDELEVLRLGELGQLAGVDPLPGLGGSELRAHKYDRDVVP